MTNTEKQIYQDEMIRQNKDYKRRLELDAMLHPKFVEETSKLRKLRNQFKKHLR